MAWYTGLLLAAFVLMLPLTATAQTNETIPPDVIEELATQDPYEVDASNAEVNATFYGLEAIEIEDSRLDAALSSLDDQTDLQTERPEEEPDPIEFREPRERNPILEAIGDFFADLFGFLGSTLGYITLFIVAAAILVGLYFMFGEGFALRRREAETKQGKDISIAPDLMPDEASARALLGDAEALARQGRFAEAVHALLFRSIDLIQERQPASVKRSLTAREIGRLSNLPDLIRMGLAPIIRIVERSYFGGRPVDENGWIEARTAYQSFAFGEAPS
jgi:hypothetical protein